MTENFRARAALGMAFTLGLLISAASWAGTTETLKNAMSYTRLGAGARARGMGNCFIGIADDVTSVIYNPAGLARLKTGQIHTMKDNLSADRSINLFAGAIPFWSGTLGVAYSSYGVSDIPETYLDTSTSIGIDFDGKPIYDVKTSGYFKDYQSTATLSWGRSLTRRSKIGIGVKRYSHELREASALGYGFDAGIVFNPLSNLSLGLSLRDMGARMNWDTASKTTDSVPISAGLGIHYDHDSWLTGALDIVSTQDTRVKVNTGLEFRLGDALALRAGLNDGNLTAGVGLQVARGSRVDASYHAEDLGPAYRLSGTITFEDFRPAGKRRGKSKPSPDGNELARVPARPVKGRPSDSEAPPAATKKPGSGPQAGPVFSTAEILWENRTVKLNKVLASGEFVMASLGELESGGLIKVEADADGLYTAASEGGLKATLRIGDPNYLISKTSGQNAAEETWSTFPVPPMKAGGAVMVPASNLLSSLGIHAIIGSSGESSRK